MTVIGASTNASSKYMGLREHSRASNAKNQYTNEQSELGNETVKEDTTIGLKPGGLSEQIDTNS